MCFTSIREVLFGGCNQLGRFEGFACRKLHRPLSYSRLDEDEDSHDDINQNEDAIDGNNPDKDQDKFDESSDEDVDISANDNTSQGQQEQQDELGTSTNFLFGARSRYGRTVRFNNRLLF